MFSCVVSTEPLCRSIVASLLGPRLCSIAHSSPVPASICHHQIHPHIVSDGKARPA